MKSDALGLQNLPTESSRCAALKTANALVVLVSNMTSAAKNARNQRLKVNYIIITVSAATPALSASVVSANSAFANWTVLLTKTYQTKSTRPAARKTINA